MVRDYWLFIELLLATDNSGKNMLWAAQNVKRSAMLTPVPWDLDGTFGRGWNGSRTGCSASQSYDSYLRSGGMQNALFFRLSQLNPNRWNEQMSERYAQLRRTVFNPDRIVKRFTDYVSLLRRSGADRREMKRWNGANGISFSFDSEQQYVEQWVRERIKFLDQQYHYDSSRH